MAKDSVDFQYDLIGGNASLGFQKLLGASQPQAGQRFVPRFKMQGHGIGKGAVEVKNEGLGMGGTIAARKNLDIA